MRGASLCTARWALVFAGLVLVGCNDSGAPTVSGVGEGSGESTDEPSPNAQILPAPLGAGQTRPIQSTDKASSGGASASSSGAPSVLAAAPPRPFPALRALGVEIAPSGVGSGAELRYEFSFPEVRRPRGEDEGPLGRAEASLVVELLPGATDRVAHGRVVLEGALFLLPEGTEFRSRVDRFGSVVVWPDGRSYRVIPRGALRATLGERRVDVMPSFEGTMSAPRTEERAGKPLTVRRVESPLGSLELSLVPAPELGDSTQLLCEFLLELVRVERRAPLCAPGELPLLGHYQWAGGGELRVALAAQRRRADLELSRFLTPPDMPIFKPGELPPDEARPWTASEQDKLFPPQTGPRLGFKNTLDEPLLVLLDGVPALRLDPGETRELGVGRGAVRYLARDFFGRILRPGASITAPVLVQLGAEPEVVAPPAPAPTP